MISVGEYKLRKEFYSLLQDLYDAQIPKCYSPDEIVETVKVKINEIGRNKTFCEKNVTELDILPNETNKTHCQITEQKADEISHPIPTFNSTESLIGISVPESGNSTLGEQDTFQTIETHQSQVALA